MKQQTKVIFIGKDIYPKNKYINFFINFLLSLIIMFLLIGIPIFKITCNYKIFPIFFIFYFLLETYIIKIFEMLMPKIMTLSFGLFNCFISIIVFSFLVDFDFLKFSFDNYIFLIFFVICYILIRGFIKNLIKQMIFKHLFMKNLKGFDFFEKNNSKKNE